MESLALHDTRHAKLKADGTSMCWAKSNDCSASWRLIPAGQFAHGDAHGDGIDTLIAGISIAIEHLLNDWE